MARSLGANERLLGSSEGCSEAARTATLPRRNAGRALALLRRETRRCEGAQRQAHTRLQVEMRGGDERQRTEGSAEKTLGAKDCIVRICAR